jgi:DNA-binding winged helix-turn-helix (wHTH) protein
VQHCVYLFDRFQLDVTRRKLLSAGGLVLPLNSRAMEALLLLVANAGQILERRRLMQTIWPDTIVEDNNLNQCILAIRKALGETAGSNQFVMTVPGRGFCFVCPVRTRIQESIDEKAATAVVAPRPVPPRPRVRLVIHHSFWIGLVTGGALVAIALLPLALR